MARTQKTYPKKGVDNTQNRRFHAPDNGRKNIQDSRKHAPEYAATPLTLRQQDLQKQQLEETIAAKDRELAAMKRQLEAKDAEKARGKRHKSTTDLVKVLPLHECPNEERSAIFTTIATTSWKHVIFMPPPGKVQRAIMESTYRNMDPTPPEDETPKEKWLISRVNVVGYYFNNIRSYVSGQVKNVIYNYADECGKKWPDLEKITACAMRNIPLVAPENATDEQLAAVEENMGVFVFYWDELLPHLGPQNTKLWDTNVRYSQTITDPKSYKDSPVTTAMEAFGLLCLENSWTYWENRYKLQEQFPKKKLVKCPKNLVPARDSPVYANGYFVQDGTKKVYFFGPKFRTRYTKSNAGSKICGGWSDEGLRRFGDLCNAIRSARMSPQNKGIEEMVLRKVCELKVEGKAISGEEETEPASEDDPTRDKSHYLSAMDSYVFDYLGLNLPEDGEEEVEEESRKRPARPQELARSDDESIGSYEETADEYTTVSPRESV
jgi:hypothetical protein